jgi:hypothetical protein
LFHRSGRKVFGVAWHHDPAAKGGRRLAWGNYWVVLGVLVHLPFLPQRAVCLPVLARLWRPKHPDRTKLQLACARVPQFVGIRVWSLERCRRSAG